MKPARSRMRVPGLSLLWIALGGCVGTPTENDSSARRGFPLDALPTTTVSIKANTFRVWLARTSDEQAEGLMFVTENDIADDQGMLFVFSDERLRAFWMKNTIISLDIAFARMDGTIVATHTMPPLTLRNFSSIEPAMFALELKSGTLARLGIDAGDRLEIPDRVFKGAP